MLAMSTPLVGLELLAACVWVGSLVCLALVASSARKVLNGPSQVALFRAIGRRYGIVGTAALLVAIGCGLALAWPPSTWSGTIDAAVVLSGVLVLATIAGMTQARTMSGLRRRAVSAPGDIAAAEALRRGRTLAGALRGTMAALTLSVLVLAAQAITR
jgi:hypothetical protein